MEGIKLVFFYLILLPIVISCNFRNNISSNSDKSNRLELNHLNYAEASNRYAGKNDIDILEAAIQLQKKEPIGSRGGILAKDHPEISDSLASRFKSCKPELTLVYKLSQQNYIVIFQCYIAANQPHNNVVLLESNSRDKQVMSYPLNIKYSSEDRSPDILQIGKKVEDIGGFLTWDNQRRIMTIYSRRPLTCVKQTLYQLVDQKFILYRYSLDDNCRDSKYLLKQVYP